MPGAPTLAFGGFTATNGFTCNYAALNVLCTAPAWRRVRAGRSSIRHRPGHRRIALQRGTVTPPADDINPGNNTAVAATTVGLPDLTVQVTQNVGPFVGSGAILRFFIMVSNIGPRLGAQRTGGTGRCAERQLLPPCSCWRRPTATASPAASSAIRPPAPTVSCPTRLVSTAPMIPVFVQVLGGGSGTSDVFVAEVDPASASSWRATSSTTSPRRSW
ncbi:MAG: hypothetical protein U0531_08570 [Dehalococcoidia bacterium]